jgi:hypothetical protein
MTAAATPRTAQSPGLFVPRDAAHASPIPIRANGTATAAGCIDATANAAPASNDALRAGSAL